MRSLPALELIEAWEAPPGEPAHLRLGRLLAQALDGEDIGADTLGRRNQRLIALRRALCGSRPILAAARCDCGVDNEVTVPADAIEAAPTPSHGAQVTVQVGGRRLVARLPTMADLAAVAPLGSPGAARAALLARCAEPGGEPLDPEAALATLGTCFEAIDPAADVRLSVTCAGCAAQLSVLVDLAEFVGRDVGHHVAALLGEVDCLARAYGWSEADILALPPGRRHRYVSLVRDQPMGGGA